MQLFQTITVGAGGATSIQFSSIPSGGRDLLLLLSARVAGTSTGFTNNELRINSSTTNIYSAMRLEGNGSASSTGSQVNQSDLFAIRVPNEGSTANTFGNLSITFANYTSSVAKTLSVDAVTENNGSAAGLGLYAGQANTTSPITSIQLLNLNGNYLQNSRASLYIIS